MKKDIKLSVIRLIGILLSFVIQILFVKLIGTIEYGVYILFTTWSLILSQVLIFGYDRFLIRELSYYYIQKEKGEFRYTLDKVFFFISVNSILFILLAVCIPLRFLQNTFFSEELLRSTWILIAIGSSIFTIFQLIGKILISIQQVELSYVRQEVIYKFILLSSVLIFFYFFKATFGLNIILIGAILSYALTIVFFLFLDRSKLKSYFKIQKKKVRIGHENYIFFISSFIYFLMSQIDKIQLGRLVSIQTLGIYGLAATLCNMTNFSIAGYTRFIPKVSYYINNNLLNELKGEFKLVVKNAVIIGLPIIIFLFVFAEDIFLFFGPKYVIASNALRALLIGQIINYFAGPIASLIIINRHAKIDMIASVIVLLLTIGINVIGYRMYGFNGVAVGTSIGIIIINLLRVIEVKYFLGIFPYDLENIFLALIVFSSFYLVKIIGLPVQNLILRLILNFSLGIIVTATAVLLFYKSRGQSFLNWNNKKIVQRFNTVTKV